MARLGWLRQGLFALGLGAVALSGAMAAGPDRWVATWATSQQIPEPNNALPADALKDATLRQVVRIRLPGQTLRVRLTNAYGTQPLRIGAATLAAATDAAGSAIIPESLRKLSFGGSDGVTIPAGAEVWSDPVSLPVAAGADLTISIYLPEAPAQQTGHPGSRATSYYVHGEQTGAASLPDAKAVDHWYQIAGIETLSAKGSAVVTLGDSITDGSGVKPNTNLRWPDALQRRLQSTKGYETMAVLNAGIGGNRLLLDGLGPNALARFDREVLSPPGVTHLIVLEGVNDLGTFTRDAPQPPEAHAAHVEAMIGALRQIVARARTRGIVAIGGTITPFAKSGYYHPDAATEADRQTVNAWIRAPGNFDAVIDFDAALRDPANPAQLRADYDSGDGLHPSLAGYQAMAGVVPLELLKPMALWKKRPPAPGPVASAKPLAVPAEGPAIAFTFDDLPAHASLPPGVTRLDVADSILATLKAAGAPATGFINGVQIEREPASAPVLDHWRAAGLPLGNHGWAHLNLADITDDQFADELARNDPLLAKLMAGQDWKWFRYPFLSEASNDPGRRARIRKLLAEKGYKVADVTMSFDDWAYNDTYARCMAKNDTAAIAIMEKAWLEGAEASIGRYRAMAKALYGRDIPYVLLMHLGAFDARMLPKLMDLYKRYGFRFVSLAEAEKDPYYRADIDPSLAPDPQGLEGALMAKGLPVPSAYQRPPLDTMCQ
ncbi:GDSL-type esterase/lipase family protein [Sphingomonas sp.]|uniref:GDSL-type esterase/lipase family protein n=1 Tax=Sphingomonas sp. TaxID=28214 RepID=UPI001B160B8C|nr:GDSL-type esterase/lipase family protein [Sphingomonas sp.]MBO9713814.1 polysaccharide deacetylase family protein [Sphingomonas sp.]